MLFPKGVIIMDIKEFTELFVNASEETKETIALLLEEHQQPVEFPGLHFDTFHIIKKRR